MKFFLAAVLVSSVTARAEGRDALSTLLPLLEQHAARIDPEKCAQVAVKQRLEELDSKGKPKSVSEQWMKHTRKDGKEHTEVLRAQKDGKDNLAEVREHVAKAEAKRNAKKKAGEQEMTFELPFAAKQRPSYRFSIAGKTDQGVRIAFAPRGENAEHVLVGEALVDPVAGEVMRMTAQPSKLPSMADRVDLVMEFDAKTAAGRALSKLRVEGAGGFLFIKKRVRSELTFSDHVCEAPSVP
jgi:hypothetical protein